MLESVMTAFDEALTEHESATSHRKAVTGAVKLIDKVSETLSLLPEDLRDVVVIDDEVMAKLRGFTSQGGQDLQAYASKLNAALVVADEFGGEFDAENARILLDRYRALGMTRTGLRDGSSRTGGRALSGILRLTFPDGKVRNSSGDWTSQRWEARDWADKHNRQIATAALNEAREIIFSAANNGESVTATVTDSEDEIYTFEYIAH